MNLGQGKQFMIIFVTFIISGCLPDQNPISLGLPNIDVANSVTCDLPGLKFTFLLADQNFGGKMPKVAVVLAHLDPEKTADWRIVSNGVVIQQYSETGELLPTIAEIVCQRSKDLVKPTDIQIRGLQTGPLYRVTVYLELATSEFQHDIKKLGKLKEGTPGYQEQLKKLQDKWKKIAKKAKMNLSNSVDAIYVTVQQP